MRRRAEQDKDFDQIKQNLFDAGTSVLKAAQAQDEMLHTSLEALAEAYEDTMTDPPLLNAGETPTAPNSIAAMLLTQRQEAIAANDFDQYVEVEKKLQLLDELAVTRLEREARQWEAQVRIQTAQRQLSTPPPSQPADPKPASKGTWTEKNLKAKYKTLSKFHQETGIKTDRWQDAVDKMNQAM